MAPQSRVYIREAKIDDVPRVAELIQELTVDEGLTTYVGTYETRLHEQAFGAQSRLKVLLAEIDGEAVGFLSYTVRESVGTYLEFSHIDDLVVSEPARRRGVGQALMQRLAEVRHTGVVR